MPVLQEYKSRGFRRTYGLIIRIGLITSGVILLFEVINLLVMYRYVKLDYYLCLVAIFFLVVGLLVNRRRTTAGADVLEGRTGRETKPGTEDLEVGMVPVMEKTAVEVAGLLSAKEWQILKLVAEGKTNKEMAADLESVRKQFSTGAQVMMALVGQAVVGSIASLILGIFTRAKK